MGFCIHASQPKRRGNGSDWVRREELITKVAQDTNVSKKKLREIESSYWKTIYSEEDPVHTYGGVFKLAFKKPRPGKDFKTGGKILIPGKPTLNFKPKEGLLKGMRNDEDINKS